ncbi:hypothetical protein KIH87_02985 [Paraneptunicella aestuarii]|uniref:hypothetical protein n=1 Tax=Paraneptunicella aestuarii TaxID=2831148 RepID=UPI001E59FDCF|nr:hypothetical protein [Paraneptunicella aestuarii]UAA39346.1 hypothetical protein KIH87_02985 [Paraneptunicella aestuarii]
MFRMFMAIILALVLVYTFGQIAEEMMDFAITVDGEVLSPVIGFIVMAVVAVILVGVGFFVTVSVFGVIVLAVGAALIGIVVAGVSMFWPVLLILLFVYLVSRSKENTAH